MNGQKGRQRLSLRAGVSKHVATSTPYRGANPALNRRLRAPVAAIKRQETDRVVNDRAPGAVARSQDLRLSAQRCGGA